MKLKKLFIKIKSEEEKFSRRVNIICLSVPIFRINFSLNEKKELGLSKCCYLTFYLQGIDNEVKETLDLWGMGIEQHQVGGAGLLQHGPDQFACDGDPVAVLLVALAVEEEGSDDYDVGSCRKSEKKPILKFTTVS